MSAQLIGPRKHRLVERETGIKFDRILRFSNRIWEGRALTDNGHDHILIDTQDWSTRPDPDAHHWTTCALL